MNTPKMQELIAFCPEGTEGLSYLEQLTVFVNCCPSLYTPFIYQIDHDTKKVQYARVPCGSWNCQACAAKNATRWIARIIDGMNNLEPDVWRMATVTAHGNWRGLASIQNLRKNWHKLRKRLKRDTEKRGERLFYVRNWEQHKDGSFHMHFVTNAGVTIRWMKDNASGCGLGHQAHINDTFNPGQAAGYMAKYMVKQLETSLYVFPKGARRFECSRNWVKWNQYDESEWELIGSLDQTKGHIAFMKHAGYMIYDASVKKTDRDLNERKKVRNNDAERN